MEVNNLSSISMDPTLSDEGNRMAVYLYPILQTIGIITNLLNICVLCRRVILISSCPYYFLAFALSSLLYVCIRCSTQYLRIYLPQKPFLSDTYWKIEAFTIYLLPVHATFMLVFASIDRFCASCYDKSYRDFSQIYLAKRIIFIITIINIIYFLPFLFLTYFDTSINDCYQNPTMINIIYLSRRVIILYVTLPIAMIIFGILTIQNIRQQRNRNISLVINPRLSKCRRNESQLACMILVQVGVYILFSLPAAITYPLITFIPSMNTPFMLGLRSFAIIWQLCIFVLSFIVYILSSRIYRNEFLRMLKLNCFLQNNIIHVQRFNIEMRRY